MPYKIAKLRVKNFKCFNNKKYYEAFTLTNDIRNKSDLTVFIIYFL